MHFIRRFITIFNLTYLLKYSRSFSIRISLEVRNWLRTIEEIKKGIDKKKVEANGKRKTGNRNLDRQKSERKKKRDECIVR